MNRKTALTLSLGILAVVVLSVAAATIDTPVSDPGGDGGFAVQRGPGGPVNASGPGNVSGPAGGDGEGDVFVSPCVEWLAEPPVVLALLALVAVVALLLYRETGSFLLTATFTGLFGLPVYIVYALLTSCTTTTVTPPSIAPQPMNGTAAPPGGGGGGSGSSVGGPTALFGLLLVAAVVIAALLLVFATGDDERERAGPDEAADESADVDVTAIGRAAGAAADRIEDEADVENEVYRAWSEMTDLLDVPNPSTSTPAEFASAAVDAGMARDDVDELTDLFEEVRYGGADPTTDREERAVGALRRIETTYAGEEEP